MKQAVFDRMNRINFRSNPVNPLKIYEKLDPELLKYIENSRDFVFAEGALPRKYKLLMGMVVDGGLVTQ